jgi:hypothetical protein
MEYRKGDFVEWNGKQCVVKRVKILGLVYTDAIVLEYENKYRIVMHKDLCDCVQC